jgi:hypothetical protein
MPLDGFYKIVFVDRFINGGRIFWAVIAAVVVVAGFIYGALSVAVDSVKFDLRIIGESVYQAPARDSVWPRNVSDLEGTTYLEMGHRTELIDKGVYVVVWPEGLDPRPAANADRILAYHNGGILSWLGLRWVCWGDLRITREPAAP